MMHTGQPWMSAGTRQSSSERRWLPGWMLYPQEVLMLLRVSAGV